MEIFRVVISTIDILAVLIFAIQSATMKNAKENRDVLWVWFVLSWMFIFSVIFMWV